MKMKIAFGAVTFPKCVACGHDFTKDESRVVVVYAGSAWKDGGAALEDGAELFRAAAYHDEHAPAAMSAAASRIEEAMG